MCETRGERGKDQCVRKRMGGERRDEEGSRKQDGRSSRKGFEQCDNEDRTKEVSV